MVNANLANSSRRYFARVQNESWTIGVQLISAKLFSTDERNLVETGRSY